MVRGKLKAFKWILLLLFTAYYCCITFFVHTHIENGIAVVHAHPFKKTADETSHHHSSLAEIHLFCELSTIHSVGTGTFGIDLNYYGCRILNFNQNEFFADYPDPFINHLSLRAPPSVIS